VEDSTGTLFIAISYAFETDVVMEKGGRFSVLAGDGELTVTPRVHPLSSKRLAWRVIARLSLVRRAAVCRIRYGQPRLDLREWYDAGLSGTAGEKLHKLCALTKLARLAFKRIRCFEHKLFTVLAGDSNDIVSNRTKQLIDRQVLSPEVYGPHNVTFSPRINNSLCSLTPIARIVTDVPSSIS
jgi:hypothetical protein